MPIPGLQDQYPDGAKLQTMVKRIKPLASVCPRLEYLYGIAVTQRRTCWRIVRERGKAVRLDFDGWARDIPRYWEGE